MGHQSCYFNIHHTVFAISKLQFRLNDIKNRGHDAFFLAVGRKNQLEKHVIRQKSRTFASLYGVVRALVRYMSIAWSTLYESAFR